MPEVQIIVGDALSELRKLEPASVQTCITSPPYYGLRDYGTGEWEGGDADCDHTSQRRNHSGEKQSTSAGTSRDPVRSDCRLCGANRIDKQIGLEPTPDAYVAKLVQVFREVKRVLRDDGTLWLNMGDSYANSTVGVNNNGQGASTIGYRVDGSYSLGPDGSPYLNELSKRQQSGRRVEHGCKPKDLLGIPWMLAFALRADGWYLRSEIIWAKPNPMPESVTDRPTKAHETVFLLSKSKSYYYDADAIAEPGQDWRTGRQTVNGYAEQSGRADGSPHMGGAGFGLGSSGRNKRSVWTVATQPYPEAHFATFPPKLVEPMVLAGSAFGATVLDPFAGSGTTLEVAIGLGRSAIGIELSEDYADLARKRLAGVTPAMFSPEAVSEIPANDHEPQTTGIVPR